MIQKVKVQNSENLEQSIPLLIEMLDIRIGLETRALKLAIPNMTESDFARARNILALCGANELPHGWSLLNFQFHMCLYESCGRPKLLELIEETATSFGHLSRARVSFVTGRQIPHAEHIEMLTACEARNIGLAVSLLEQHIEHTQRALIELHEQ
ncbi:MAG: GntR family transcriptional regulator [Limnobacter sp.]|uniref:GntR family transcriptional regulator n=1 Tax=Limnobacter sp. TaxID=2003368 RepID=UPI0032EDF00B